MRIVGADIAKYLERCPSDLCDLIIELRKVVLKEAPGVAEAIRFHQLCYFKPDQPYGAIGGNVCMIEAKQDHVRLSFIHGASLADPDKLLRGTGKAKRFVEIRTIAEARRPAIRALIRKARAYSPQPPDGHE